MRNLWNQWQALDSFKRGVIIALIIISLGCAAGIQQGIEVSKDGHKLAEKLDRESLERRDESCRLQERDYERQVQSLKNTYGYLDDLTPEERKSTLNQVIIRQLSQTEARIREYPVPSYCDDPNMGLKEPNPIVPARNKSSQGQ